MAASQVIEYTTFVASDAFLADRSLADKALDYLEKCEGALSIFHGFQIEDPSRFYLFIVWKTYENFDKTLKRTDFPRFLEDFHTLIGTDFSLQHIDFDEDPVSALGAPVTELSIGRPTGGYAREELDSIVLRLKENSSFYQGVHPPLAWGSIRQKSEFVLAIGWDSVEAHQKAIQVPPADTLAKKLSDMSDVVVRHVVLHKT